MLSKVPMLLSLGPTVRICSWKAFLYWTFLNRKHFRCSLCTGLNYSLFYLLSFSSLRGKWSQRADSSGWEFICRAAGKLTDASFMIRLKSRSSSRAITSWNSISLSATGGCQNCWSVLCSAKDVRVGVCVTLKMLVAYGDWLEVQQQNLLCIRDTTSIVYWTFKSFWAWAESSSTSLSGAPSEFWP